MLKLMVVESHELPREICFSVAKELHFNLVFFPTNPERPNEQIISDYLEKAQQEQVDAIIVSYYHSSEHLSSETSIPIITINFSNWETLNILLSTKKNIIDTHIPHPHKVALITTEPLSIDLDVLSEVFGIELHNILRDAEELPDSYFHTLKAEGFEVAVCADRYHNQVIAAGMYHAFDPNACSHAGLLGEFRKILRLITISSQASRRSRELQQMMNYSFEAIWMTDSKGIITSYNANATGLFQSLHPEQKSFSGCRIQTLLSPEMSDVLEDTFSNGTTYYNHLLLHTQTDGIFNITPIKENETVTAVIFHFTALPHLEQMEEQLRTESYIKGHKAKYTFQNLIGESASIRQVKKNADLFAKYDSNILLMGETGTGKEIFAQSIHNASRRCNQPFVALNCGALPPNLLESELFGYVDGAFTGASKKGKKGLFEIADQGTIFLDEISEMDANGQLRLLRVLEEREVMRVGSDRVIPVNVRVIAACNKNLTALVEKGQFREDLLYRLNVLTIHIPALRERERDAFLLANYYLDIYSKKYEKTVLASPQCADIFSSYSWPGNVRQLRNFCERLVIISDRYQLTPDFVREQLQQAYQFHSQSYQRTKVVLNDSAAFSSALPTESQKSPETLSEKERILSALRQSKGSRQEAALLLGISTTTLWRKMKKYQISENYSSLL